MSEIHALLGQIALVLGAVAAVWSIGLTVLRRTPGSFYLGGLVWVVLMIGLAGATGLAMVVAGRTPGDVLHVVYGILALAVLPGAAVIASGRADRERAVVAAVATIVLAILLMRLLQTGA